MNRGDHLTATLHKGFIFLLAFCGLLGSHAADALDLKATQYDGVERFTDTGARDTNGVAIVRWEQGTLFVKEGFVPITSQEYPASTFQLDAATLNAINGKAVDDLSTWISYHSPQLGGYYSAFERSTGTYSIRGVPSVIVSVAGVGGGGGTSPVAGKPTVVISAVQPNAAEAGPANGRFLIALDAARTKDINVVYAVAGRARNGKDYAKIPKNVLIPAGNVSAYVDIVPVDDTKREGTESVKLTLTKRNAYKLGRSKSATVSIADNE